jgi:general secretion pathway protein C
MPISASLRALEGLTPQQWLDRASRTLPQFLSALLAIAIAWQLVQLTWLLLDRGKNAPAIVVPPSKVAGPRTEGPNVDAIAAAHLFGTPEDKPANPTEAPKTQANLLLSAVFATNDPAKGLAIIGETGAAANVYSVGDAVRSGIKLDAVYPDRVLLNRNGQREALLLPTQNVPGMKVAQSPPAAGTSQFQENLRHIAQTNPGALAEIIRPQPVFANGVQRGYRVYPGRNRQQFARLGLQPGDLVLTINGTPLDDPQRGMEIFNTMGTSDRVTVTIERNGQSQDLTLNTAQITLPDAGAPADANGQAPRANRDALPQPPPSDDDTATE